MTFVNELNARFFDGQLSATAIELLEPLDRERLEVQQFVERMARQMQAQQMGAQNFSALLAWVVGAFVAKLLPGAWGGSVPPITLSGRHARIDDYMESNPWGPLPADGRLLDLGCGFPPITTVDSARRFPGVRILGADPSFGHFLVREANDDYACFNANAELLYFQPGTNDAAHWESLYADPEATRARFSSHLERLRPSLSPGDSLSRIEANGVTLVRRPVLEYQQPNLRFDQRGIGSVLSETFDIVRCFNVLVYFDRAFRQRAVEWSGEVLDEGGLFLAGMDWSRSRHARYSVFRREHGRMVAKEFAISIENIRPLELVAFFALHDDDYDTRAMAQVVGTLRADETFRRAFDARMDEVLSEIDFCARGEDGYLGAIPEGTDPQLFERAADDVGRALEEDGFAERAVDVLRAQGYDAWVNCVGHLAVDPSGLTV